MLAVILLLYTSGSQTFSVHGTLIVHDIFHCTQSQLKRAYLTVDKNIIEMGISNS